MNKMFKLNTVLKIVILLYDNSFQETANLVCSSFSLCSDVAAVRRLTLSKKFNYLKRIGGDCCTQPFKFKQQQMHVTKNGDDKEQEIL